MMLSVLTAQIQAQLRDIFFSQNNFTQLTNYGVALFELQHVSVIQCADLCFCNNCCKEIIFNSTSHQCIGLHFPDFDSNSTSPTIPIYEGNLAFQKGCENDWVEFGGHCYILLEAKSTWAEARLGCQKMCSYLVEIDSTVEAEWIAKTFINKANCGSNPYVCTAWTGGNDLDVEGQYRFDHSNTLLSYTNWHPNEPSLAVPNEALDRDCIDVLSNGQWNDRPCSFQTSVICEKSFKN